MINELNTPKNYDDNDFLEKFCIFDNIDAAERLCRHIFTNEKVCEEMEIENSKENILIYPGKITDSFINFAQTISEKYNIFITYNQWDAYFKENCAEIIEMLPENVELLPFRFNLTPTFDEKKDYVSPEKQEAAKLPVSTIISSYINYLVCYNCPSFAGCSPPVRRL